MQLRRAPEQAVAVDPDPGFQILTAVIPVPVLIRHFYQMFDRSGRCPGTSDCAEDLQSQTGVASQRELFPFKSHVAQHEVMTTGDESHRQPGSI